MKKIIILLIAVTFSFVLNAQLTVDPSNGNVGVKDSTPEEALTIGGNMSINNSGTRYLLFSNSWSGSLSDNLDKNGIRWQTPGQTGMGLDSLRYYMLYNYGRNRLLFDNNDDYSDGVAMSIKQSGEVGIGVEDPLNPFHVEGDALFNSSVGNLKFGFPTSNGYGFATTGGGSTLYLYSYTNTSTEAGQENRLSINEDGDMGIGITNATEKLDVDGNMKVRGQLFSMGEGAAGSIFMRIGKDRATDAFATLDFVSDVSNYPAYGFRFSRDKLGTTRMAHLGVRPVIFSTTQVGAEFRFLTEATSRMVIKSDGAVGIGVTTPDAGTILHINGQAVKPGGGDWGMASDRQLKQNINSFELGLEEIMQIKPVTYQYNGKGGITDTETEYVGVIAQDFQKVAPYAIDEYTYAEVNSDYESETFSEEVGPTETYLSVDATSIRYMLVNAVQEQQETIEDQQKVIERQERIAAEQEEMIGQLQKEMEEIKALLMADKKENIKVVELSESINKGSLSQNTPNPFEGSTRISYTLPKEAKDAFVNIVSQQGQLIKTISLDDSLNGTIEVRVGDLPSGAYSYSLIIDGQIVDTKQMILK